MVKDYKLDVAISPGETLSHRKVLEGIAKTRGNMEVGCPLGVGGLVDKVMGSGWF